MEFHLYSVKVILSSSIKYIPNKYVYFSLVFLFFFLRESKERKGRQELREVDTAGLWISTSGVRPSTSPLFDAWFGASLIDFSKPHLFHLSMETIILPFVMKVMWKMTNVKKNCKSNNSCSYLKHLAYINSFNPHNSSMGCVRQCTDEKTEADIV